jgi:Peptidase family C25
MMKKLLFPVFMLMVLQGKSQLNNSWIDYSKTYFKFRVNSDTLCRITQPALTNIGLGSIPAQNFQLWRNGKEVRLYTSVSSGALGVSDYIEFLGEPNDGKPDNTLYPDTDLQLWDKFSLFADTAIYFLTVNPSAGNLRYANAVNAPPGALVPEPYFMRRVDYAYRDQINRGSAAVVGEYVYASDYDQGEGWSSNDLYPGAAPLINFQNGLNVFTAGPPNSVSFRVAASGNALYTRNFKVSLFNTVIIDTPVNYFGYVKINKTGIPLSALSDPDNLTITMRPVGSSVLDRMVVAGFSLTYPARFIFNNQKNFYFELPASGIGNYIVIDNFNFGSIAPVLYDLTAGLRYIGDITSTPGKVKFVLPPSLLPLRKFKLVNVENTSFVPITAFTVKTFVNYGLTANQGDYLIISHPSLFNNGSGVNNVDLYRQYRSSIAGGGFNSKILDINELNDQFAFGIKKHPVAIRDFVRYAYQNFTTTPKYIFIIGRGMDYHSSKDYESDPATDKLNLVQTFGWPASDNLLAAAPATLIPLIPIGRLATINGNEVGNYLDKIRQYELAQASNSQTIADKGWMKNIIHVSGGKDSTESATFTSYLDQCKIIAEDTLFGAHVESFAKSGTGSVQQANSQRIEDLFKEGLSFIQYFGHSSANILEFNLSSPEVYQNSGKYPFFAVSGCSAGNFFLYNPLRLNGDMTLSEKYVLAPQRGSIGFLADTHFGIPPYLNDYNVDLYTQFGKKMYGNSIGNQLKKVITDFGSNPVGMDYYMRVHLEEIALHGDPALKINSFAKPDYVVEDQLVKISPSIITVADANFNVSVKMMNIGKAIRDSIRVTILRKLPNDSIKVLYNQMIPAIKYMDSVNLVVPINPLIDKGLNKLIVTLDVGNRIDELSEINNTITKDFYIFEDELRPIYPYNYAIVSQQNITYSASTANPLSGIRQYIMEVDTTELYNSPFKKIYNSTGPGGVVQFAPTNLTLTDSTVYYWRTAMIPTGTNQLIWNSFSFTYLAGSSPGFNQGHYYQHLKDNFTRINLGADRKFRFNDLPRLLTVRTGLYPYYNFDRINVNLDFDELEGYGCQYYTLQFYVLDSTTLAPWINRKVGASGRFNSWPPDCVPTVPERKFFEFPYNIRSYRKGAMDFIDSVPNGNYVVVTNFGYIANTSFIDEWKGDTAFYGSGKSLYHKLKSVGFSKIDSFTHNLPFLFFFKKGSQNYSPTQVMGPQDSSYINESIPLTSRAQDGIIETPVFGPAKKWNALHWRGTNIDAGPGDTVRVQVWGIRANGTSNLLATVSPATDTTLAFISAVTYPYVKLSLNTKDEKFVTPNQLRYLLLNADYVPEGAVAPGVLYKFKDTVEQGEKIDFSIAFKNISPVPFDSMMKVNFRITDRNNLPQIIPIAKRKIILASPDTLVVNYSIDTKNLPGNNTLFIEFNPANDQPEQYHFNNILYKDFFVKEDKYNPLLDVTFDAVHILNRDIVASKPHILIKLKDESKYLALSDTALLKVQVRFPDNSLHSYRFSLDTLRFTPANLAAGENTATIDFMPYFAEDGEYELIVSGKDVVGNKAGELEYNVVFNVINRPMISNLLNYPNPFTTSTAFVFYVTGAVVPQNIRIQILTITGKVVREVTKDELGPIHIGRNITDFKWDGTDMYGQKLANGVYLYRVLTNLNGSSLEKFTGTSNRIGSDGRPVVVTDGVNKTDKYFNKGYGKMYLMR